MTCPRLHDVASYTLGTLDPAERDATAAHLPECPECRAALDSVAGLPGLLAQVDLADVVPAPRRPDPAVLDRVLREVSRANAGRRRRLWVGAVAAVLVLGLFGGLAGRALTGGWRGAQSVAAVEGDVHARVWWKPVPSGTAVRIRLQGVQPDQRCRLVASSADGAREVVASWQVEYADGVDVNGTTWIPADRLASWRVETDAGVELVSLDVPAPGATRSG